MKSRMNNVASVLPEAQQALFALGKSADDCGVPKETVNLIHLRASQINGCGVCVDMHPKIMKKMGETDERIFGVAAWREMPYYTDAERAALALTESVTRLADKEDGVPEHVWDEAARHFDEKALAGLLVQIGLINVWNRFNAATRQVVGTWKP